MMLILKSLAKSSSRPFEINAFLSADFLSEDAYVASFREPSEVKSCALTSNDAVLSSPRPTPKMIAFPPRRVTFIRNSKEDCECAYRKAYEEEAFHSLGKGCTLSESDCASVYTLE